MEGQIAISEDVVKFNRMECSVFDLFRIELKRFTTSPRAGWYAYIKRDGVYYFKWIDHENEERITKKYLESLRKDGYCIGMGATAIEDAFR
jgi:hypothetical protein